MGPRAMLPPPKPSPPKPLSPKPPSLLLQSFCSLCMHRTSLKLRSLLALSLSRSMSIGHSGLVSCCCVRENTFLSSFFLAPEQKQCPYRRRTSHATACKSSRELRTRHRWHQTCVFRMRARSQENLLTDNLSHVDLRHIRAGHLTDTMHEDDDSIRTDCAHASSRQDWLLSGRVASVHIGPGSPGPLWVRARNDEFCSQVRGQAINVIQQQDNISSSTVDGMRSPTDF